MQEVLGHIFNCSVKVPLLLSLERWYIAYRPCTALHMSWWNQGNAQMKVYSALNRVPPTASETTSQTMEKLQKHTYIHDPIFKSCWAFLNIHLNKRRYLSIHAWKTSLNHFTAKNAIKLYSVHLQEASSSSVKGEGFVPYCCQQVTLQMPIC